MLMISLDVLMRVHMRVFRLLADPAQHDLPMPWDVRVALHHERFKASASMLHCFGMSGKAGLLQQPALNGIRSKECGPCIIQMIIVNGTHLACL